MTSSSPIKLNLLSGLPPDSLKNNKVKRPIIEKSFVGRRMGAQFFLDDDLESTSTTVSTRTASSKTKIILESNTKRNCETKCFPVTHTRDFIDNKIGPIFKDDESSNMFPKITSDPLPDKIRNRTSKSILTKSNTKDLDSLNTFPNDDEIVNVTEQLKLIQETQDAILDSLRSDIELIQTENVILKENNLRLQNQVSHLNQLVADLNFDLRQMRDVIRCKESIVTIISSADGRKNDKILTTVYNNPEECESKRDQNRIEVAETNANVELKTSSSTELLSHSQSTVNIRSHRTDKHNRSNRQVKATSEDCTEDKRQQQIKIKTKSKVSTTVPDKPVIDNEGADNGKCVQLGKRPQPKSPKETSNCFTRMFRSKKSSKPKIDQDSEA